ncbi:MAG: MucR family transcriptional regulator, partial [Hyphomicrobiales bacterium]|nr:MucR family transcriptional regulator [Hyphomicrobiales bacterium]
MEENNKVERASSVELAAEIVSAYVANNTVPAGELANLIVEVHSALARAHGGQGAAPAAPAEPQKPAVPPKKSLFPDYIICLEDG